VTERPGETADGASAEVAAVPVWRRDHTGVVVAGAVFVLLAFAPWYDATVGADHVAYRAWDLGLTGVLAVLLSAYAALRTLWLRYRPLGAEVPLAPGAEPFAAAFVALLLTAYRALDIPSVPLANGTVRTIWLSVAMGAVTLQAVFAGRVVARTGFRA
jgi:hypothetical protein